MILLAYGTRPEYIKIKPLIDIFDKEGFPYKVLFTGQHKDLLKEQHPDHQIEIIDDGNNRLDNIVKSIMTTFSWILDDITHVLVQGDTTSVLAVALSAYHHGIKVIHLEAGLRTYDRENPYPEETNRRVVSQIADVHLCPTRQAQMNIFNEKLDTETHVVGNTVIDNLLPYKEKCEYTNKILVTMHRRENHHWLNEWFVEIDKLAEEHPEYEFIIPLHPNPNVQKHKDLLKHVKVIDPLPYEEMLELLVKTRFVITDSGGLQEECSFFNKKCLTCRKVTERPEAVGQSTIMVEAPNRLKPIFDEIHNTFGINYECPYGDGHSAEKIFEILKKLTAKTLNDYFTKIVCINLDNRPDRYGLALAEFKKLNIDVERVSGIEGRKIKNTSERAAGAQGLLLTHINLIEEAIRNKYENILILEDDVLFIDNFHDKFNEKMPSLPDDWDLLYFGGINSFEVKGFKMITGDKNWVPSNENYKKLDYELCKTRWTQTTHAIAINSKFYEILLKTIKGNNINAVDSIYCILQRDGLCNAYTFLPSLVAQRPSFSDIEDNFMDYVERF